MTISQTTELSKPVGDERIPDTWFAYFRSRNRHRVYSLLIKELERSGISQATLAKRMGRGPDQISRWLSGPANMELDTLSAFLFAISGAEPAYSLSYPLDQAARNSNRGPDWVVYADQAPQKAPPTTTGSGTAHGLRVSSAEVVHG